MPRLRAKNGAVVEVPKEKVDGLLARGFTTVEAETKKAPAKKSASSKKK